jgi:hypothetical protein
VEAAPEPDAKAEEPKAESAEQAETKDPFKQYRDPESGRLVPLHELKSERQKRQDEARLRQEAETRAQTYERQIQELLARVQPQQQQQPQQAPPQAPDPWTDPEGYQRFVTAQAQWVAQNERLNTSEMLAVEKHGEELVNKAVEAAKRHGVAEQFVRSRNPYGELVKWFQKQSKLETIGDDFDSYEKRLREEGRQAALAELKKGPAQPQRFPGTLADGTASGAQGAVLTDEAMMADVFGSDRRARKRA